MLRSAKVTDAPLIADIYNYYVDNTCITFALEHSTPQIYANMIAAENIPFWSQKQMMVSYPALFLPMNCVLAGLSAGMWS